MDIAGRNLSLRNGWMLLVVLMMGSTLETVKCDRCVSDDDWSNVNSQLDSLKNEIVKMQQRLESVYTAGSTTAKPQQKMDPLFGDQQQQLTTDADDLSGAFFCYSYTPHDFAGIPPLPNPNIGIANSQNCAPLNSMTSFYPDIINADIFWTIVLPQKKQTPLPETSNWMYNIKLCVRGQPNNSGLCNGQPTAFKDCQPIGPNNNTLRYQDLTYMNINQNGCKLSWSVLLPPNAPALASGLQICVNWQPFNTSTTEERSCAAAVMDKSKPNWTNDFVDDAYASAGRGYLVQWGLYFTKSNR